MKLKYSFLSIVMAILLAVPFGNFSTVG